ncbi:ABC transporter permease subunit [Kibdelosporangium persicum]|uniref:ABC transporter permease n=1 Tax=Kibdelosporangium persicum TaxID=2698649 RepID=A0ABX2F331_9PSEU|nr:ABC transporter permease subunit [Kibdelosporangium persicum]NRN65647.1 ABC transporter permease [Kibdelosporangium persicum]
MIWASWRRQRAQLITLLGMVVIGAGVITLLRSNMIDAINSSQLAHCVTQAIDECSAPAEVQKAFRTEWATPFQTAQILIIGLPALIGVFIGAPLFARELEQGTHVLAFTQSVSRTRWMVSKLVVALVPALIVLIVLQYLVWWWLTAAGALGPRLNGSFNPVNFGIDHVSPVGYALFAFALGTFVGVVSRRTLVAMTVGLGAFVVVRFALSGLVNDLVPAQRREVPAGSDVDLRQGGGLELEFGWLNASGQPIPHDKVSALIQACKSTPSGTPNTQEGFLACLPQSGLAKKYTSFIPESQAWQVHLVDAAIFGGLAVLLLVGTAWALRRQS